MNRLNLSLFSVLILLSTQASASWMTSLNIGMSTRSVDTGGGASEYEATFVDLTHGLTISNNIYLGGLYGTGSGTNSYAHFGASVGIVGSEWQFMGHYLLGGNYTLGSTDYKEGTGTQFDLGHISKISNSFHLGVQMSSRSMTYKPDAGSGSDLKITELYPSIKLTFVW